MRSRKRFLHIVSVLVPLALCGCVSIDPRIATEDVDRDATQQISGRWINGSVYGSNGRETLADAVGGDRQAEDVTVHFEPRGGISFDFTTGESRPTHVAYFSQEVSVDASGAIVLRRPGSCKVDAAVACDVRVITIFVNSHKEMVVASSIYAAGAILVAPVVVHAKSMWTFIRRTGDSDLDNIPRHH